MKKLFLCLTTCLLSGCFNQAMLFNTSQPEIKGYGLDKDGICHSFYDEETKKCQTTNNYCPVTTTPGHIKELTRIKEKFCGIDGIDTKIENQQNMCKKIDNIMKCPGGYEVLHSDGIISEFKNWELRSEQQ